VNGLHAAQRFRRLAQGARENGELRRNFTVVIRSFTGGPSSNQMEETNRNHDDVSLLAINVMCNQIEDE